MTSKVLKRMSFCVGICGDSDFFLMERRANLNTNVSISTEVFDDFDHLHTMLEIRCKRCKHMSICQLQLVQIHHSIGHNILTKKIMKMLHFSQ